MRERLEKLIFSAALILCVLIVASFERTIDNEDYYAAGMSVVLGFLSFCLVIIFCPRK